jgi:hypothetical protein
MVLPAVVFRKYALVWRLDSVCHQFVVVQQAADNGCV